MNTEWLKGVVARQGWGKYQNWANEPPSRRGCSSSMPMPIQHSSSASADGAALATEKIGRLSYDYLYDRLMLKLAGKQRYATQATCRGGMRVPQPLKDESAVDRLRSRMGLKPLPAYLAQLQAVAGDCPPDRPPPAASPR